MRRDDTIPSLAVSCAISSMSSKKRTSASTQASGSPIAFEQVAQQQRLEHRRQLLDVVHRGHALEPLDADLLGPDDLERLAAVLDRPLRIVEQQHRAALATVDCAA